MDSLIINLRVGNLKIARHQAKQFPAPLLFRSLTERGYSEESARLAIRYLKGKMTYQAYCDNE